MRVEFLGHGLHKDHSNTVGHVLVDSFKNDDYYSFIGFSAFTKMSGINRIKKELLEASKKFKSLKFYLGIVPKGTSREALQFLIDNNIETWIFCTKDQIMFHPKIYFFQGKHNYRFITGSSNLTSFGLFDNIEASTFFEFSKTNQQGKKLVRQFEEYFEPVLNGTDKNVQKLTQEVLKDLEESGFIWPESKTNAEFEFVKSNKEAFAKRKKLKFDKDSLGKIESKPSYSNYDSDYIPAITQDYLNSWPDFFDLFKEFKKENKNKGDKYSVVVPRDYKNPSLYNWYLKQKIYHPKLRPNEENDSYYAYGWDVHKTARNTSQIWHNGSNNIFYADFMRFIDEKTTLIFMSNKSNQDLDRLNFEVAKIIFEENYTPTIPIADNETNQLFSQEIIDTILSNGLEKATIKYKSRPTKTDLLENILNAKGYELLSQNKFDEAISIFTMNTIAYPKSYNAFDSLGEAYMIKGEKVSAIKNYEKSLQLDPTNGNAENMIKKLKQ